MNRATYFTLVALVLVSTSTAQAATTARWTPSRVATRIKASYTTVDAKAVADAQEHIDALLKAGASTDDPLIVSLREDQRKAQHASRVTRAACSGVGAGHRFTRFHCTARVMGAERTPPDHLFYTATVKLTVTVHGAALRILNGWR